MFEMNYMIIIILQLSIIGLGVYLRNYLKIKAENLATIEDIGKVTEEVEAVKYSFSKLLEEERSINLLMRERSLDYNRRVDEMLFEFFEDSTRFYNEVCKTNSIVYDVDKKIRCLDLRIDEINKVRNKVNLNEIKLASFFKDESELNIKYKVLNKEIDNISIKWFKLRAELFNQLLLDFDDDSAARQLIKVGINNITDYSTKNKGAIDRLKIDYGNEIKNYYDKSPK